jgi:hypothetical protein
MNSRIILNIAGQIVRVFDFGSRLAGTRSGVSLLKRALCVSVACLAALNLMALSGDGATITVDPDAGVFSGSGDTTVINGVVYRIGALANGGTVREIFVHGDMNLNDGDIIQASLDSTKAVRFVVGGNANIAPGAVLNFAAENGQTRGGGGIGAAGGAGGTGGVQGGSHQAALSGDSGVDGLPGGQGTAGVNQGPLAPVTSLANGGTGGNGGAFGANGWVISPAENPATFQPGDGGIAGSVGNNGASGAMGGNGIAGGVGGLTRSPNNAAFLALAAGNGGNGGQGGGGGGTGGAGGFGGLGGPGQAGAGGVRGADNVGQHGFVVGGDGGLAGLGGSGGSRGSGGDGANGGGNGGDGGAGGAGGGAVEIRAYGVIRFDGLARTNGSDGTRGGTGTQAANSGRSLGEPGSLGQTGNSGLPGGNGDTIGMESVAIGNAGMGGAAGAAGQPGSAGVGGGTFSSGTVFPVFRHVAGGGGGGGGGGRGGDGGHGGDGGFAAAGGVGGAGAGGGGGTVLFNATVVRGSGQVNVAPGVDGDSFVEGTGGIGIFVPGTRSSAANGNYYNSAVGSIAGANQPGVIRDLFGLPLGNQHTVTNTALLVAHPFVNIGNIPYLPSGVERPGGGMFELVNGTNSAEAYGRTNVSSGDPVFAAVVAGGGVPQYAIGAMARGSIEAVTGVSFSIYEGLYVMSMPGGPALQQPKLGGLNAGQSALLDGGYATRSEFGGSGPTAVAQLASGEVYATTIHKPLEPALEFSAAAPGDLASASGGWFTAPDYTTTRVVLPSGASAAYLISPRLAGAPAASPAKILVGRAGPADFTLSNLNTQDATDLYAWISDGEGDGSYDVNITSAGMAFGRHDLILSEGASVASRVNGIARRRGNLNVAVASNDAFAPTQYIPVAQGVAPLAIVTGPSSRRPAYRLGESVNFRLDVANFGDGNESGLGSVSNLRGELLAPAPESGFAYDDAAIDLADLTAVNFNVALPTAERGTVEHDFDFSFVNGSNDGQNNAFSRSINVKYQMVGPEFAALISDPTGSATMAERTTVRFGSLAANGSALATLKLLNETTDVNTTHDISDLVQLYIHSANISGPDAGLFSMSDVSNLWLDRGGEFDLGLSFLGAAAPGDYRATLTIDTDQFAQFVGGVGQSFSFDLAATVREVLAGDYNNDDLVDAADYTVWRDHFGAPAGSLPNDVDGGMIGQAQYDTWKANFGLVRSGGGASEREIAAVPEPATLILIVVSVCGLAIGRPRCLRRR